MVESHKAKAVLAKHDQTPKPQHVIKHYIMSAKSTVHLNLHAYETSVVLIFFFFFYVIIKAIDAV